MEIAGIMSVRFSFITGILLLTTIAKLFYNIANQIYS